MTRLDDLLASESQRFVAQHPQSATLAQQAREHWLGGVPMHWMADWGTPHPFFVREATGATLTDVDGIRYTDFCLGDTGAMFGHSPPAIAQALAAQGARGLTCMLPAERTAEVGAQLAALFGLPYWQIAQTATDANRYALRWARAITGRPESCAVCRAKSTTVVVPPKAAALVPLAKVSQVIVGPITFSMCTWVSTPPGSTYRPVASTTFTSGPTSSAVPMARTTPPCISTSAT